MVECRYSGRLPLAEGLAEHEIGPAFDEVAQQRQRGAPVEDDVLLAGYRADLHALDGPDRRGRHSVGDSDAGAGRVGAEHAW